MANGRANPKVGEYLEKAEKWRKEMVKLRAIVLDSGLTEELKWGMPCYSLQGKNVVMIQGFKAYCALLFFKGALLSDPEGILVKMGKNTHVGRQIRFTDIGKINALEPAIKAFIFEAIEAEKAGLKMDVEKGPEPLMPVEFQSRLDVDPALKAAFDGLTPGRRRAYIMYFSEPKQAKTQVSRVEKYIQKILAGKGLRDL